MNKDSLKSLTKKEWHMPFAEKIMAIIRSFSLTEKAIFAVFSAIFIVSGLSLLYQVNKLFLVQVPDYGGKITEGVVGSPRFVNPILASSDIDRDLTSLLYSGLLKVGENGELLPDLAESFNISDDGLTYTFVIKNNAVFHDGKKVTADDVIFTIEKAEDTSLKSPREVNWRGVKVEKIDDRTVTFSLKQAYSPFIQNATLGILPKHIWNTANVEEFPFSQFNINPVGAGPYKVDSITYSSSGLPSEYHLTSFNKYTLGRPYITTLVIKSYSNEKDESEAYKNGSVDSVHGISPKQLSQLKLKTDKIILSPLPRIFGVFFNQNVAPVLVHKEVRTALSLATDNQDIVNSILGGYGQPINSPVPVIYTIKSATSTSDIATRIEKAKKLLTDNGWVLNSQGVFEKTDKKETQTLSFAISTGDAKELKDTAFLLQKQWSAIGAKVDVKIFEISDLNQNIIKPRKYDALLFGEVIGRDQDLYPFWHSSQRTAPGLNIAQYANVKTDKILENLRKTIDPVEQKNYFVSFQKEISNDVPAVFTYSPYFIYIVPDKVQNVTLGAITAPSERFSNISKWYIETNNVWKIFTKNKN
ncbi:hypothetical protein H0W91_01370 [Patescibacteria group bacterium]|nr:hypothetical protein [Patescibacteria group bacterium]